MLRFDKKCLDCFSKINWICFFWKKKHQQRFKKTCWRRTLYMLVHDTYSVELILIRFWHTNSGLYQEKAEICCLLSPTRVRSFQLELKKFTQFFAYNFDVLFRWIRVLQEPSCRIFIRHWSSRNSWVGWIDTKN